MSAKLGPEREAIAASELIDLKQWKKLQDLLAQVIGFNLNFLDAAGSPLVTPSQVTPFCADFVQSLDSKKACEIDCAAMAYQHFRDKKQQTYQCPHGLCFAAAKILRHENLLALLLIGPLLAGGRKQESIYRIHCEEQRIDADLFCDRIREIKVSSHHGMRLLRDFFQALLTTLSIVASFPRTSSLVDSSQVH